MKMEESRASKPIQIQVLGEIKIVSQNDFRQFVSLISIEELAEGKVNFQNGNHKQGKIDVLNVFLYYIISIQKNIKLFNDSGQEYRGMCSKKISPYYIKSNMSIDILEFSMVSAKVLSLKLEECAHIIYYLIYGRFASHPYIRSICSKNTYDLKRKTFKKTTKEIENDNQINGWGCLTAKNGNMSFQGNSELQIKHFCKELKSTLTSSSKVMEAKLLEKNKKQNSLSKVNSAMNFTEDFSSFGEKKRGNCLRQTPTFIPQRITQNENSSVIENMPFHKQSFKTCTDWNQKGLMRKQKFNQFFDPSSYNSKSSLRPFNPKQDKQNLMTGTYRIISSMAGNLGKINYQNFKNISSDLKNQNNSLDKIRVECSTRNQKARQIATMESSENKKTQKTEEKQETLKPSQKCPKVTLKKNKTSVETKELEQTYKQLSMERSVSYQPQSHHKDEVIVETVESGNNDEFCFNILKSEESKLTKESDRKMDYFAQTTTGFGKMNCKYKLQKYKSDYRKFMKSQLLDRIRQAT